MRHRQLQRAGGFWGAETGPNPTDRAKAGSKHHVLTDRARVPLAATVSAANAHDVRGLLPTVVACPLPGYGSPGRTPRQLLGDRAYRSRWHGAVLRWLGIRPRFARPGTPHGSGLGKQRWVVERTIAHLHQNRRLKGGTLPNAHRQRISPATACPGGRSPTHAVGPESRRSGGPLGVAVTWL